MFNISVPDFSCYDQYFCQDVDRIDCDTFPSLKESCPISCGLCSCEDKHPEYKCKRMGPFLCKISPQIRNECPKSCDLCTKPLGK